MAIEAVWAICEQIPCKKTVAVRVGFDSRNLVPDSQPV